MAHATGDALAQRPGSSNGSPTAVIRRAFRSYARTAITAAIATAASVRTKTRSARNRGFWCSGRCGRGSARHGVPPRARSPGRIRENGRSERIRASRWGRAAAAPTVRAHWHLRLDTAPLPVKHLYTNVRQVRVGGYLRPGQLSEAVAALAAGPRVVLAGGTDFYPARVGRPLGDDVLDITALEDLRHIVADGDGWRVPALATWTDLIEAELPPLFDGLKRAAREIGGRQIQNAGTVCGNLCNASPAADGVPNLLALDAVVELVSTRGQRTVPARNFVTGNRRTMRRPDELVTALRIPKPRHPSHSTFLKLGARKYLVISIAMVAAVVEVAADRTLAAARIAIGACSEVAQRLPELERDIAGRPLDPALADIVRDRHLAPLKPIDDVRGSAAYRIDAALTLVRRAIADLASRSS
ncbi:MAG: FAD binding domain-containing protein [Alphaproteobacteria bacterium]|nr:FAD binding domain-containing protein [Alphaproteobacteria bacterium]